MATLGMCDEAAGKPGRCISFGCFCASLECGTVGTRLRSITATQHSRAVYSPRNSPDSQPVAAGRANRAAVPRRSNTRPEDGIDLRARPRQVRPDRGTPTPPGDRRLASPEGTPRVGRPLARRISKRCIRWRKGPAATGNVPGSITTSDASTVDKHRNVTPENVIQALTASRLSICLPLASVASHSSAREPDGIPSRRFFALPRRKVSCSTPTSPW